MIDPVEDAVPARFFAHPPYTAELFSKDSAWSGVMNSMGMNVLTFRSKPGAVITSFETAQKIAAKWNSDSQRDGA